MPNSPADAATESKKPFPYRLIGGEKGDDILEGDDESRHRRIQALLAQWMRMENVVVLMGSGCSCSPRIGGLSMYDLESHVLALLERRYQLTSKGNLLKVISSRRVDTLLGDHDTPHFEQWLEESAKPLFLECLKEVRGLLPQGQNNAGWRRMAAHSAAPICCKSPLPPAAAPLYPARQIHSLKNAPSGRAPCSRFGLS